jgi:hypothetical protein
MVKRRRTPLVLSHVEQRIVQRHCQRLAEGGFETVQAAVLACLSEFERLRRESGSGGAAPPMPKYDAFYRRVWRMAKPARFHASRTLWSRKERRVLDRFVRSYLAGRYPTLLGAAGACAQEFGRLMRLHPEQRWAATPRTVKALATKIRKSAILAGWEPIRFKWTQQEERICDRYARALARHRYIDLRQAADDCRRELSQRRRRGRAAVLDRLGRRAREFGWAQADVLWLPHERRVMDASVQRLLSNRELTVQEVARDCHGRLCRLAAPGSLRSARGHRRTFSTILTYLQRRMSAAGRTRSARWLPEEDVIVEDYAHRIARGEYTSHAAAVRQCGRALDRCQAAMKREHGDSLVLQKRTRDAVCIHLSCAERRLNKPRPRMWWRPSEDRLCRDWLQWYARHRPRRGALNEAGAGLRDDLKDIDSRRTVRACAVRIQNAWLRQQGLR